MILGVGIDIVDLAVFRAQLADRASVFVEETFTAGERRESAARPSGDPARHLAARYAAKEALIKAWSGSRFGEPVSHPQARLRDIEIVSDAHGRPAVRLHGAVAEALTALAHGRPPRVHLSLSHDGGYACATVILEAVP